MNKKEIQGKLIGKIAPKRVLDKNTRSFGIYDNYKKTVDIIERAERASGKSLSFKSDTGSTLNFEINRDGVRSTTSKNF